MKSSQFVKITIIALAVLWVMPLIYAQDAEKESVSIPQVIGMMTTALEKESRAYRRMVGEDAKKHDSQWLKDRLRQVVLKEMATKRQFRINMVPKELHGSSSGVIQMKPWGRLLSYGLSPSMMYYHNIQKLEVQGEGKTGHVIVEGYLIFDLDQIQLEPSGWLSLIDTLAFTIVPTWDPDLIYQFKLSGHTERGTVLHQLCLWQEGMKSIQGNPVFVGDRKSTSLQTKLLELSLQQKITAYHQKYFEQAPAVVVKVSDIDLAKEGSPGKYKILLDEPLWWLNQINVYSRNMVEFYTNEDVTQIKRGDRLKVKIQLVSTQSLAHDSKEAYTLSLQDFQTLAIHQFKLTQITQLSKE